MKAARFASSPTRGPGPLPRLLRRFVSWIPARWRGAVLLTGFTLLFPLWITLVLWEAVLGDQEPSNARIETATPQN